ncbi:MAG: hypothetical protein WAQ33_04745 [Gaiellaceae bacterium]
MNALRWRMILSPRSIALIVVMTVHWPAQALYVATKIGIADLLRDGPKTVEQLADRAIGASDLT